MDHANSAMALKIIEGIKATAVLTGSRGRARFYGRPEPEDADYDYMILVDDARSGWSHLALLEILVTLGFKRHARPGGFLTVSGLNHDISVYPKSKLDDVHEVWALIEAGVDKDYAWEIVNLPPERLG